MARTAAIEADRLPGAADPLADRLRDAGPSLSPAALRVARFIAENRVLALASSAADLAARVGTSDATVVRAVQALGFDGLPDLRRTLAVTLGATGDATPADTMRGTLAEVGAAVGPAVDLAIETQREAA